jgi:hypothetical protein
MPKGTTKRTKKHAVADEDVGDVGDVTVQECDDNVPKQKKNQKHSKSDVKEHDSEDELSDLDVEEECTLVEQSEPHIVNTKERRQHAIIDPSSRIGDLKVVEIFSYLIQLGKDDSNPNPILASESLKVLRMLTGKQRPPRNSYGSTGIAQRGSYNQPKNQPYRAPQYGRNNGMMSNNQRSDPNMSSGKRTKNVNESLYDDN